MRSFAGLAGLMAILALGSGSANAQLDCSAPGSCTTIKYGLGTNPAFRHGEVPLNPKLFGHEDFGPNLGGISYIFTREDPLNPTVCADEKEFNPNPGQVILRETTPCTPTSEGPKCAAGDNAGKSCHLGANAPFASIECPGSTCVDTPGTGCRAEIPISDGGKTDPADTSEYWVNTVRDLPGVFSLGALTGNGFGGSSSARECTLGPTPRKVCSVNADCGTGGTCQPCFPTHIRQKPSMATRYLLPEYRRTALGLPAGATYLRWDKGIPRGAPGTLPENDPRIASSTAFRIHQDDAAVCCNSPIPGFCSSGAPLLFTNYPLMWRADCTTEQGFPRLANEDNIVPDWIFEASANSRFFTDPEFEIPGIQHGVCRIDRDTPCTRGGTECDGPGDTCDFREPGIRIMGAALQARDANGDPNPTACGVYQVVLRGTPWTGCTLEPRYVVDGDPGPDCGVFNYGVDQRADDNCDGTPNLVPDKCPFLSEWDASADADDDCLGGVDADCRGDECECGDATLDGHVDVLDIVEINLMIYGARPKQRIADANSDLLVNVSDIVAANQEIYVHDSSSCRHITSIRCGNDVRNEGEACDNGARCVGGPIAGSPCDASALNICGIGTCERISGDGCNPACRIEDGWTCTGDVGQPSVCTRS